MLEKFKVMISTDGDDQTTITCSLTIKDDWTANTSGQTTSIQEARVATAQGLGHIVTPGLRPTRMLPHVCAGIKFHTYVDIINGKLAQSH